MFHATWQIEEKLVPFFNTIPIVIVNISGPIKNFFHRFPMSTKETETYTNDYRDDDDDCEEAGIACIVLLYFIL